MKDSILSTGAGGSWRPGELAATKYMHVQVVDTLAAFGAVVDDESPAILEAGLISSLSSGNHEMAKQFFMLFFSLGELRKALPVFGNQDEMHGGLGVDILKGETLEIKSGRTRSSS